MVSHSPTVVIGCLLGSIPNLVWKNPLPLMRQGLIRKYLWVSENICSKGPVTVRSNTSAVLASPNENTGTNGVLLKQKKYKIHLVILEIVFLSEGSVIKIFGYKGFWISNIWDGLDQDSLVDPANTSSGCH